MGDGARVSSIDAIREFREAFCGFSEDARAALTAVDMEVHRAVQWLTRDRVLHWQMQIKRCNQDVSTARTELFRRKLASVSGEPPDVSEKKELLRIAQRRLQEAESKLEAVKRWVPVLQHAISEYHSKARPLGDKLDSDLPHALALLDRMSTALDAYIALAPPSTPEPPPAAADLSKEASP
jgi:hypothetical protein